MMDNTVDIFRIVNNCTALNITHAFLRAAKLSLAVLCLKLLQFLSHAFKSYFYRKINVLVGVFHAVKQLDR